MRFLVLGLFLVLASTACSVATADTEPGREYSGAFASWFYQTNEVSIEAGAVQAALVEAHDDDGIRTRLRELAITQTSLNSAFANAKPHPFWEEYHPSIVEAMRQFDEATAPLRGDAPLNALAEVAGAFKAQEDALLQIVIDCYTQTKSCPR